MTSADLQYAGVAWRCLAFALGGIGMLILFWLANRLHRHLEGAFTEGPEARHCARCGEVFFMPTRKEKVK